MSNLSISQTELDRLILGFKYGVPEIDPRTNKILIPPEFMSCSGMDCGKRHYCLRYYIDSPGPLSYTNLCKKYRENLYIDYELRVFLDNEYLLEQESELYLGLRETLIQVYETYEKDCETYRK